MTVLVKRVLFFVFLSVSSVSARTLDLCFSPKGYCDQVMISWIKSARISLDAAIYGLTDENIAQALIDASKRGVRVRVVHDKTQAAGRHDVSEDLREAGVPVHIQRGSQGGIQHNKFLVIDSTYVITGSFNWTRNASAKNDENFVILDDVGPKFQKEFERLWALEPYVPKPKKIAKPTPRRNRPYFKSSERR